MAKKGKNKKHVETAEERKARRKAAKKAKKEQEKAEGKKDALQFIKRFVPWGTEEESDSDSDEAERPQLFPGASPALVTVSSDTTLRRWDLKTGTCQRVFLGHEGTILSMDVNFDSWVTVTGSTDNTLALWDIHNLYMFGGLAGHEGAVSGLKMDWANDRCVSCSYDQTLRTWAGMLSEEEYAPPPFNDDKCTRVLKGHTGPVVSICVDWPNGKTISASQDNRAKLWDLETGRNIVTLGGPGMGHTGPVWCVNFNWEHQQAYTGSMDRHVMHWDLRMGQCTRAMLRHEGYVTCMDINWDTQEMFTGSCDRTIAHWDLEAGEVMERIYEHSGSVWCLNVDWPGTRMVSGGGPGCNAIRLFNLEDYYQEIEIYGHDSSIWQMAVDWELAHTAKRELEAALKAQEDDEDGKEEEIAEKPVVQIVDTHGASTKISAMWRGMKAREYVARKRLGLVTEEDELQFLQKHTPGFNV